MFTPAKLRRFSCAQETRHETGPLSDSALSGDVRPYLPSCPLLLIATVAAVIIAFLRSCESDKCLCVATLPNVIVFILLS